MAMFCEDPQRIMAIPPPVCSDGPPCPETLLSLFQQLSPLTPAFPHPSPTSRDTRKAPSHPGRQHTVTLSRGAEVRVLWPSEAGRGFPARS